MTKNFYAGSAKIYQFPVRRPPNLGGDSEKTKASQNLQASNLETVRITKIACGSAWYHEEAIQDEKAASKN